MPANQPTSTSTPAPAATYHVARGATPEEQNAAIINAQELDLRWLACSANYHVYIAVNTSGLMEAFNIELLPLLQP